MLEQVPAIPEVLKAIADPLTGYDRYALVRAGLVAWSYPQSITRIPCCRRMRPTRSTIFDDEAVDFIATEVLRLTKPALFHTTEEAVEKAQKSYRLLHRWFETTGQQPYRPVSPFAHYLSRLCEEFRGDSRAKFWRRWIDSVRPARRDLESRSTATRTLRTRSIRKGSRASPMRMRAMEIEFELATEEIVES